MNWGVQNSDLDLHLFFNTKCHVPNYHVSYCSKDGSLQGNSWAKLHDDVTESPPGVETIVVSSWHEGSYEVWIHDYSKGSDFPNDNMDVRIITMPDGRQSVFNPCTETKGRWWWVCNIHNNGKEIEEINIVQVDAPSGETGTSGQILPVEKA